MYALKETETQQAKRSKKYNAKMKPVVIKEGGLLLMFDNRSNGSVQFEDMDGGELET
jgi:hypothetical protein